MAHRAPTESEVEQLRTLVSRDWTDGHERTFKTLTLRKIEWHHRDHREFAVLRNDVLLTVVDLDEWLRESDGDAEAAARRLAVMLDEMHRVEPANGDEWVEHWQRVRDRASLID